MHYNKLIKLIIFLGAILLSGCEDCVTPEDLMYEKKITIVPASKNDWTKANFLNIAEENPEYDSSKPENEAFLGKSFSVMNNNANFCGLEQAKASSGMQSDMSEISAEVSINAKQQSALTTLKVNEGDSIKIELVKPKYVVAIYNIFGFN